MRRHGVSFETAVRVFFGPSALSEQDRIEGGEYRLNADTPPPLTEAQRAELKDLAATNDSNIDYSDIPANADWTNARRGVFYRPAKQSTTVRIDADVLHWLKAKGRGYQTWLNAILCEAMLRDDGR